MESIACFRERIEASEHQTKVIAAHTHTVERRRRGRRGIACGVGLVALLSLAPFTQAADFACAAGDVACLIDAINTANANGEANTITLAAGTYTLTAVDNDTGGPNGLPSITSELTLRGAGPDRTILERAANAPAFRLLQIAAQGNLRLKGLTVQRGSIVRGAPGGGLQNLGTLTLHDTVVRSNFSDGPGAGLQNLGTATLTRCAVISNFNLNVFPEGGAIENEGTMTIHRCSFKNNSTEEFVGSVIENRGRLLLTASALTGAFPPQNITNDGVLLMLNSTSEGSTVTLGGGRNNKYQQHNGGPCWQQRREAEQPAHGHWFQHGHLVGVEPHCRPDALHHCAPADRPDGRPRPRHLHRRRHAGQRTFPAAPE